jgi:predicted AAA+ superfamily ATPase
LDHPAYVWNGAAARGLASMPRLSTCFRGSSSKEKVSGNVLRHAAGHSAHDMLLWGSRGMGKSALRARQRLPREDHGAIALVQVAPEALPTLTTLFSVLRDVDRPFLVFLDDLGLRKATCRPRALRSWLEGASRRAPQCPPGRHRQPPRHRLAPHVGAG